MAETADSVGAHCGYSSRGVLDWLVTVLFMEGMMKLGLRDLDWAQVGADLARGDSNDQTDFFKAFIKEMNSWGTRHQVEMQLAYVNGELSKEERKTLGMLSFDE